MTETDAIYIPEEWSMAAEKIAYDSITSPPPIAVICGPKNSGKTTFSRHLVTTLIPRYDKVAYLDTDVGQPEFTSPGCLSLCVIDKQDPDDLTILTLKDPERWLFFGDVSSKRDPKTYLDSIFSLYDYFRTKYHMSKENEDQYTGKRMLPLVVNTPGWVKGVGFDILVEMLRYISPTHVVQVRTSSETKNLPTQAFWLDEELQVLDNHIKIYAARQDSRNQSVLVQKDARLLRDLRIISYFRLCFPSEVDFSSFKELAHALASHPPYEVSLSSVKVTHLHCQVPSNEVFRGLNATIVGLAISSAKPSESESCTPWCVGLGIVRGVDPSKDLLYVLTPVPPSILEKVDLLLQGFLQIPIDLLKVNVPSS
ncbi:hypothetical protein IFM89_013343 [Coptis chinensis]|uniref:Polynucleotide 5'-hydroxyl-kinase NOL9 n=1 Tax=Coptis chinensis TaxID=261450 RepID=A0A835I1Y9_9MAGN|nr:hypothetical protein IFM89_013343 [Coptis chinensis]